MLICGGASMRRWWMVGALLALVAFNALPVGAASPPKPGGPFGINGGPPSPKAVSTIKPAPKRNVTAAAALAATGKTYASTQIINDPNNAVGEYFGTPVTLSKDNQVAVISATQTSAPGTVYVYTRDNATGQWVNPQALPPPTPNDLGNYYQFGFSTAINNDPANRTIIVGTRGGSGNFGAPGAAYVYVLSGGVWIFQQELSLLSRTLSHRRRMLSAGPSRSVATAIPRSSAHRTRTLAAQ